MYDELKEEKCFTWKQKFGSNLGVYTLNPQIIQEKIKINGMTFFGLKYISAAQICLRLKVTVKCRTPPGSKI